MIIFDEPDIAGTILFLIRFLKSPRLAQQLKIQFNGWRSSNANGSTKAAETLSEVSAENANGCNAPAVSCSWVAFITGNAPNVPSKMAPLNILPQFWMCACVSADQGCDKWS